jgi:hypothetical protein
MTAPRRALPAALAANRWKPGQSGNPQGHSGLYGDVVKRARELSIRAIERLGELMESQDERVASVASSAILDRAFGKARERTDNDLEQMAERIRQMTSEQRRAYVLEILGRARALKWVEPDELPTVAD